jgi:putative ABC transport system permease protein
MIRRRLLLESVRSLRRYRFRSMFVAAGTLVGVALVTLVLSLNQGVQRKMGTTIRQIFGGDGILVGARGTSLIGGPRPDAARLTVDDIAAVVDAVPGIAAWDPQQAEPSASVRAGGRIATVRVLGQSAQSPRVWDRPAIRGRFFDDGQVRTAGRVAVIGESAAAALFPGRDPIGQDVLIEAVPFTVIGVLQRFGTDIHGMDRDNEIVVPVTTLMRRVLNVDTIVLAKLVVIDADRAEAVAGDVRRVLRQRHALQPGQHDDFTMLTPSEVRKMSGMVRRVMSTYAPLAATIILAVSAAVAALLMLSSVSRRRSEVGLRRAVGAMASDISTQFMLETACMVGTGGVLGIVLGLAAARFAARALRLDSVEAGVAMTAGLVLSMAAGFVAGWLPARRAARIEPAVALR